MRIAHFADAHLGYRRGHVATRSGVNQREADVAASCRAAVDQILAARPEAVVFAGELFHTVRPSNLAIRFAVEQFQRLTAGLPGVPVCLIAGNHDSPKTAEAGDILHLLEVVGVQVAVYQPRVIEADGLTITLVPHAAMSDPALRLEPTGRAGYQVLVIHGDAEESRDQRYGHEEAGGARVPGAVGFDRICMGHYHVSHQVDGPIWYAGSTDYVSSNPWGELVEERDRGLPGKGWLLHDLALGQEEFHHIPTRRHVDFPRLNGSDLEAGALIERIRAMVEAEGGVEGAVARLVVTEVPKAVREQLDLRALREIQRPALDFKIDLRKADERSGIPRRDRDASGRRLTLPELVAAYMGERELPPGMDREAFNRLCGEVLEEVTQDKAATDNAA